MDASGELAYGRKFADILELQNLLAARPRPLLLNLGQQLAVYSRGRALSFGDRTALDALVRPLKKQGGGIRTLVHELVQSNLFQIR